MGRSVNPKPETDQLPANWFVRRRLVIALLAFALVMLYLCGLLEITLISPVILTLGWIGRLLRMLDPARLVWPVAAGAGLAAVALLVCVLRHIAIKVIDSRRQESDTTAPGQNPAQFRWVAWLSVIAVSISSLLAGLDLAQALSVASRKRIYERLRQVRIPGAQARTRYNLSNIHRSQESFLDKEQFLPPLTSAEKGAAHSWVTMLLPYHRIAFDGVSLYGQIDRSRPWDDPVNLPAMRSELPGLSNSLLHPSGLEYELWNRQRQRPKPALNHYAVNQQVFAGTRNLRFRQIKDGTTNTIFAGEVGKRFVPWGKPGNCRHVRFGINNSPYGFGIGDAAPMKSANFVMGDGSVRTISENIDSRVLQKHGHPLDGY